jgi:hypothetical protein
MMCFCPKAEIYFHGCEWQGRAEYIAPHGMVPPRHQTYTGGLSAAFR